MTLDPIAPTLAPDSEASLELGLNPLEIIETVISGLDQSGNPLVNHSDDSSIWKFTYGSATVFVQLTGTGADSTITTWSPVLNLPVANPTGLYAKLLELNWLTTLEARFAIFEHQVMILTSRTLAEIGPGEIARGITIVATLADDYDDALQAEFPAV
ncbi:YbjN domain-containing protein [Thermosynechococcaceae cyanobacterium BACA0444]|uniref:YbjN domain-containing protein n=1 Tax=Pseudocalidococcus azoricus BACA0444 TaxID=2918990 RepID=A0AAE4FSZ4_9CYAN|nr:YbjN domain-containing protein [Pseudocalidococcus azoricus]MDS3861754.1 YbjN domain-containing protein [Pseudocalidococcus azoricus BACA0444]